MSKLVGIVNITPDSFSDGGKCLDPKAAIAAIQALADEGASVIDIGAESTRPGATPVMPEEEWQRLEPVLSAMPGMNGTEISVDTRHAQTARKALEAGVHWINDVSGFSDIAMVDAVKKSNCKLVVMHSLSVPADKHIVMDDSAHVIAELLTWAKKRIGMLEVAGISRGRIIFDPGLGFGKTSVQSLKIIEHVEELKTLGVPLLIGHSRKSFLDKLGNNRDSATLAVSQTLAKAGVDYLRVHDVLAHRKMLGLLTT